MCTVLLPPGDNPIAVNKYIISYHIKWVGAWISPLSSIFSFRHYWRPSGAKTQTSTSHYAASFTLLPAVL